MLSGATSEAPVQIPQAAAGKPRAAVQDAPPQPDDTGVEADAAREAAPDPQGFPAALAAAGVVLNVEAPGTAIVGGEAAGGAKPPTAQALPQSGKTLPLLPLAHGGRPHSAPPLPMTAVPSGEAPPALEARIDAVLEQVLREGPRSASAPATSVPETDGGARGQGALDLSFLNATQHASAERVRASAGISAEGAPGAPGAAAQYAADARSRFDDGIGQRLIWMANQGAHDARVRVHPEHLGPIDIHVRLNGEAAHVSFSSPHSLVRDALADAVPRLREMLGDAGLSLAHAGVDSGGPQSDGSEARTLSARLADAAADAPGESRDADDLPRAPARRGLVDTFA